MNPKSFFRRIFGKPEPVQSYGDACISTFKANEGIWLDMFYSGYTDQSVIWYYEKLRSHEHG